MARSDPPFDRVVIHTDLACLGRGDNTVVQA
jgi:hypothetical protein